MDVRQYLASYSLARRATFASVAALVSMLLLAGLALAVLFVKGQIEQSRVAALTQASVASSTVSAALRFGGSEVIAESLYVFDSGPNPDSAAVYNRDGRLLGEFVAYGEVKFPPTLTLVTDRDVGLLGAKPIQLALGDEQTSGMSVTLGTLVVNPNQRSLNATFLRALTVLGLVLAITAMLGAWVARLLSQAMLRPILKLTAWAEAVSKSPNLQAAAPRVGGQEVSRLITSFESLIVQLAEQNRELKRKQYELKTQNEHLETMAFSDALTGLPNRASFESALNVGIAAATLSNTSLAVIIVDIDNLRQINEKHGRAQGDAAVLATAARIRRALHSSDFLARLAGVEFVVISANVGSALDAVKLGERLTVWLGISLPDDDWAQSIRASIGVVVFPHHGIDANSLMHAADQAMFRAKALPPDDLIRVVQANVSSRASQRKLGVASNVLNVSP